MTEGKKQETSKSECMRKVVVNKVDPKSQNFGFISLLFAQLQQLEKAESR